MKFISYLFCYRWEYKLKIPNCTIPIKVYHLSPVKHLWCLSAYTLDQKRLVLKGRICLKVWFQWFIKIKMCNESKIWVFFPLLKLNAHIHGQQCWRNDKAAAARECHLTWKSLFWFKKAENTVRRSAAIIWTSVVYASSLST